MSKDECYRIKLSMQRLPNKTTAAMFIMHKGRSNKWIILNPKNNITMNKQTMMATATMASKIVHNSNIMSFLVARYSSESIKVIEAIICGHAPNPVKVNKKRQTASQ